MSQITVKKLPKFEVEISLKIPWGEIKKSYDLITQDLLKQVQVKGFRKGKAPQKIAEEKLDKNQIYSLVIQEILPKYYEQSIKENNLNPIVNPRISLVSARQNQDWEVKILICEKPAVDLNHYQEEISKLNREGKIWVPGKGEGEKDKEEGQKNREERIQKIIKWLIDNLKLEISPILIEEEVNRKLSQLLEQTQKLGITIDQYSTSVGKTTEQIKSEYRQQAEEMWKLELVLNQISDEAKIVVEDQEIEAFIEKAGSEEEKKSLIAQKYVLASLVRRQKTLDFLVNL